MQVNDVNKRLPLTFLSLLPKERVVLDFVLSKLVKGSSPERFELIAAVFNLHLTSAGFDPMALSKARFKRVKASEFRQALREIDAEVALIMQTEEYRQVLTRQTYLPDLFQQYLQLSSTVRQSGRINSKQFNDFATLLREKDASDLMLGFIRQHKNLFEASLAEEDIQELLKHYTLLLSDQQRSNEYVRGVFELRLNELLCLRGIRNTTDIQRNWDYFCAQVAEDESGIMQAEILEKVIRSGSLTAWPAKNLRNYLAYLSGKTEQFYFNQHAQRYILLTNLAQYYTEAGFDQRIAWLDDAEENAKKINGGHLRAPAKLLRAKLMSDQANYAEAIRYLDEAEYHIHRIQDKDLAVRHNWIEIARARIIVYTLSVFSQQLTFHPASFEAQLFLLNDIGRDRNDIKTMTAEMNGITLFLQKNWIAAYESFVIAGNLQKEEEEDHPSYSVSRFFCALLEKAAKPDHALLEMRRLEAAREPWYSFSWIELMRGAKQYFESNLRDNIAL